MRSSWRLAGRARDDGGAACRAPPARGCPPRWCSRRWIAFVEARSASRRKGFAVTRTRCWPSLIWRRSTARTATRRYLLNYRSIVRFGKPEYWMRYRRWTSEFPICLPAHFASRVPGKFCRHDRIQGCDPGRICLMRPILPGRCQPFAASSACSMSAMMSSICSMPMESRT